MADENPDQDTTPAIDPVAVAMETFKNALVDNEVSKVGPLWRAWHYLQVYSVYGLRLPSTNEALANVLKVKDPLAYTFFPKMQTAYEEVYDASVNFSSNVFPRVVGVGEKIKAFGEEAKTGENGTFSAIVELLNEKGSNDAEVRDLIQDLQNQARANADEAAEVGTLLTAYGDELKTAKASLAAADQAIKDDEIISDDELSTLNGDENTEGSIAYFNKMIEDDRKEYDHDVVVAATTPTYAWLIGIGSLAATIVAAIYGSKAVAMLKKIEQDQAEIDKAENLKTVAENTRRVQNLAKEGVDKATEYTDYAILQVAEVEKGWDGIATSLGVILAKLNEMTTTVNGEVRVRARRLVKDYARRSGQYWLALWDPIVQLTSDPFIVVEDGNLSIAEFIARVEESITTDAANQNQA